MRRSARVLRQRQAADSKLSANSDLAEDTSVEPHLPEPIAKTVSFLINAEGSSSETENEQDTQEEHNKEQTQQTQNEQEIVEPRNPIINIMQNGANNAGANNGGGQQGAADITFTEVDKQQFSSLATELTYKGFNSVEMRKTLIAKYKTVKNIAVAMSQAQKSAMAKDIIMCITAYIKIGNSSSKALKAVGNADLSQKLSEAMRTFDIRDSARDGDGVTLARMAISMIPLVFLCSKMCKNEKRFNISCPPHLQDPCFRGVPEIRGTQEYKDFLEKWNEAMSGTAGAKDNKKNINWDDVAILGYEADGTQSAEMTRVFGINTSTSALATDQLAACVKNLLFP